MLLFDWNERKSAAPTRRKIDDEKRIRFLETRGRKNPYTKRLKKQITIRVGVDILEYFKELAEETGIPYQNLINLYLRDCVISKKRPSLRWLHRPAR